MKARYHRFLAVFLCYGLCRFGIAWGSDVEKLSTVSPAMVFATGYATDTFFYRKLNLIYTEAFKLMQIPFQLMILPKERALRSANSGWVDGDASRIKALADGGQFPNLIRIDVVVNHSYQVAFVKDKKFSVKSWDDIKQQGLIVGYPRGQVYAPSKIKEAKIEDRNIVIANDCSQLLQMLVRDRINLYIDNLGNCINDRKQIKAIGVACKLDEDFGFPYIHKKHKKLIPALTKALKEVLSDPKIKMELSDIDRQSTAELDPVQVPKREQ